MLCRRGVVPTARLLLIALALVLTTRAPAAYASFPRQAVAVAFLEPKTEIDVDVVTGAVSIGGFHRNFFEQYSPKGIRPNLAGFVDPYTHRVYIYRSGGIPKLPEVSRRLSLVQVPGAGLPEWHAPYFQAVGTHRMRIVLSDGRHAEVQTDQRRRATSVRWPEAHGSWITSTIDYRTDSTTIRMPFGVKRTYIHDRAGRVTKIRAPGASGHEKHDVVAGLLDTRASARHRNSRLPALSRAEDAIDQASHGSLGNVYIDQAQNGGYEIFGADSVAAARRINRRISSLGLLDVAEAIPERASFRQFKRESDRLDPLFKLLGQCVVSTGIRFGVGVEVEISRKITAAEVDRLDSFLVKIPDWVYISWGSVTECVTPD
jgi:hypothetical protein